MPENEMRKPRLLVAEDNPIVKKFLKIYFSGLGYQVTVFDPALHKRRTLRKRFAGPPWSTSGCAAWTALQ
jgi:CheY-like chemotaxis protein